LKEEMEDLTDSEDVPMEEGREIIMIRRKGTLVARLPHLKRMTP